MNAIGGDLTSMLMAGVNRLGSEFGAMVVANQATNFSVGANIMLLLIAAQEGEWDEVLTHPPSDGAAKTPPVAADVKIFYSGTPLRNHLECPHLLMGELQHIITHKSSKAA